MINKRKGPGVSWSYEEKTGFGSREMSGYTVDNLDSKNLEEAENDYERTFIKIRAALEANSSYCMDVEEERLHCAQAIADVLHGRDKQ